MKVNKIGEIISTQNTPENIDWNGISWRDRTFSHPERTIRIGSSCSGIGAPEWALKRLGLNYEIMFAGDIDKHVKKAYMANYGITEDKWHDDMTKFDATPYKGQIDIFFAGICCQPFSVIGKKTGLDHIRGNLYKAFCRIVRQCKPKIFILENVPNMLKNHNGHDWEIIKSALDKLGYDIHYQVLDAKDYNVPQHRERVFIIGFKKKTDFLFPAPVELEYCIKDFLDHDEEQNSPRVRKLTPREALKFMGFGDDFKIEVSDRQAYHQAGNSIVVDVLMAIFKQMDITKYGKEEKKQFIIRKTKC